MCHHVQGQRGRSLSSASRHQDYSSDEDHHTEICSGLDDYQRLAKLVQRRVGRLVCSTWLKSRTHLGHYILMQFVAWRFGKEGLVVSATCAILEN